MTPDDKVNVLLVDDQPAKLLAYDVILRELGENLIKAASARDALECLLRNDVAVILIDVCMPELDGFQLAAMIREHPRFQKTAIIFISAIHLTDVDRLRGYEMGAVDYVPVPVVPEVLRAKVRVFAELYRKTRELERLNAELESRVAQRTAELQSSTMRLMQSEQLRSLALAAGQMGSWDWDMVNGQCVWDEGQCRIFGVDPKNFRVTAESVRGLIRAEDVARMQTALDGVIDRNGQVFQTEFRVIRPNGEWRWCIGIAAANVDHNNRIVRISGVTVDITDRKETEERQALLVREVDHRARNALAVVQSIVRLTRAKTKEAYMAAIEGRITALSRAHVLLSESRWEGAELRRLLDEELAPYRSGDIERIAANGPAVFLPPSTAQIVALTVHELATNAAKYGALSTAAGRVQLDWRVERGNLAVEWLETAGPAVEPPESRGYGTKVISASVERQLGGCASFEWRREGLCFNLSIPLGEKPEPSHAATSGPDGTGPVPAPAEASPDNRLLLVEDEMLVGMMMSEILDGLGFEVVGPIGRVSEALKAIEGGAFDAAVLDVNLHGEMVYPVAEALAARKIPFIFVTGYASDGIDARFAAVPLVQKPIERQSIQNVLLPLVDAHGNSGKVATAASARVPQAVRANRGKTSRARVVM